MRVLKTKKTKSGRTVRDDKIDKKSTASNAKTSRTTAAAAAAKEKDGIRAVTKKHPPKPKKANDEKEQQHPFQIKSRFFCWDDGVEYPAFVKKLAGQTHGQQTIEKGHVYVKWINFPGGKVVPHEDLLPFSHGRIKEYRAWEEQITMESDSEEEGDVDGEPQQDHAESDDDQDVNAKCLNVNVGSRFFAIEDGLEYPVLVKKIAGAKHDKKIIAKGHCYIKWIGYHGGTIYKVSDLLSDTARRRKANHTWEMKMAMESGSDEEEDECNPQHCPLAHKQNDKRHNSSIAAQVAANASDDEEGVDFDSEDESQDEEINQEPYVGMRFFVLQKDVPYPVMIEKSDKKQPIVEGTCTVKWIGFRGKMVVHYSDLLAYTKRRQREYRELTNRSTMARKAKTEKRIKRVRLVKKRKAEEERGTKKRQKMETKRLEAKDLDLLYGPATDISGLEELGIENQAEGRILAEPEKNRFVYFARDFDTPQDVAREFQVDVEKIVFDNIKFTKKLTKFSQLVPFTPIVIPIKWGGSTVKNPCQVVKQEDGVIRRSKVVEDVAASPALNKPLHPS
jgi:hypothetical protein